MDVSARERLTPRRSAPAPTVAVLVSTIVLVAVLLAVDASGDMGDPRRASVVLALLTGFFAVRVAGQLVVLAARPTWLPPMGQWNLLPYPILLPIQVALLARMTAVTLDVARGGVSLPAGRPSVGYALLGCACAYWAGMGARYAVRMRRRPGERWFGGTIPIVFHCVLAAWLFALGLFHAAT
jgi:uncharacterized protein